MANTLKSLQLPNTQMLFQSQKAKSWINKLNVVPNVVRVKINPLQPRVAFLYLLKTSENV